MKRYKIFSILFCLLLGGGILHSLQQGVKGQEAIQFQEIKFHKNVLPTADKFIKKTSPLPYYKAYATQPRTGKQTLVGITYRTTDIVPEITGYSGPIEILVGMDLSGVITGTQILSHSETPSYVKTIDQFVKQFTGKNPADQLKLGEDINGISQATITSETITHAIRESSKTMAVSVLNLEINETSLKKRPPPLNQIFVPIVLFAIAVLGLILKNSFLRWTALSLGLFYFGLMKSTMLSAVQIVNIGLLKFPAFHDSPLWYSLIILMIITSLIWGRIYCGSICPFASVQEFLYNTFHKLYRRESRISFEVNRKARLAKYILLLVFVLTGFIAGNANPAAIEPFLLLFTLNASKLGWIFLFLILFVSLFHFRFWCKYLCPTGALTSLLSRISLFKIRLENPCPACAECERICPVEAIHLNEDKELMIDHGECILCGKCMKHCPNGKLRIKKYSKNDPSTLQNLRLGASPGSSVFKTFLNKIRRSRRLDLSPSSSPRPRDSLRRRRMKNQDKIFIIFFSIIIFMSLGLLIEGLRSSSQPFSGGTKVATPQQIAEQAERSEVNTLEIKQKLNAAGIQLHEAKYWKTLD